MGDENLTGVLKNYLAPALRRSMGTVRETSRSIPIFITDVIFTAVARIPIWRNMSGSPGELTAFIKKTMRW